jgi:hypothetical protein
MGNSMNILFLDLENTVIDDLESGNFIEENVELVRSFVVDNNIDEVIVWSWAIFDTEDVVKTAKIMHKILPFDMGVLFSVVDVFEMSKKITQSLGLTLMLTPEEMFDFFDKETSLLRFLEIDEQFGASNDTHDNCWLIDDTCKPAMHSFETHSLICASPETLKGLLN